MVEVYLLGIDTLLDMELSHDPSGILTQLPAVDTAFGMGTEMGLVCYPLGIPAQMLAMDSYMEPVHNIPGTPGRVVLMEPPLGRSTLPAVLVQANTQTREGSLGKVVQAAAATAEDGNLAQDDSRNRTLALS